MNLQEIIKMLIQQPMSQQNVQSRSYENMPDRSTPTGRDFMYSSGVQPQSRDLGALLQLQQSTPVQQRPTVQPSQADMLASKARMAMPQRQQQMQRSAPMRGQDQAGLERLMQVLAQQDRGVSQGPNANIQDDSRERALAFIRQNYGG